VSEVHAASVFTLEVEAAWTNITLHYTTLHYTTLRGVTSKKTSTLRKKSKFHSEITNVNLYNAMRIGLAFQKFNQMLILFRSKDRPKFHFNKISLGYF